MPKARVLIVSRPSLFAEGIEGLLRRESGVEILGPVTDQVEAIERIKAAAPDVIVLIDGEAATVLSAELLRLVREGFPIRIVEVHLATNTICLYCGEQQPIREVRDLVDTVQQTCDSLNREAEVPLWPPS